MLEPGADYLLTVKTTNPRHEGTSNDLWKRRRRHFPPLDLTPTLAGRREIHKGQPELRVLRSRRVSPEQVGFPFVEQVALVRRHLRQHAPEGVPLMTSLPPSELSAAEWLAAHRAAWGIESGLHQRLDVSHQEDTCRVRWPRAVRLMATLRRFSNSLFVEWRLRQKKPQHKTTTDLFGVMMAKHCRYAFRWLQARPPSLQTPS